MKKAVAPVAIIVLAVAAVLLLRTGDGPDVRDESAPGTKKAERRIASRAAERRNGGDATADRSAWISPTPVQELSIVEKGIRTATAFVRSGAPRARATVAK